MAGQRAFVERHLPPIRVLYNIEVLPPYQVFMRETGAVGQFDGLRGSVVGAEDGREAPFYVAGGGLFEKDNVEFCERASLLAVVGQEEWELETLVVRRGRAQERTSYCAVGMVEAP